MSPSTARRVFSPRTPRIDNALLELRANDGRLPEVSEGDVGVAASIDLLERNISRHHPKLDRRDVTVAG